MSTFRLQNRIREEEKRVGLSSFDGQYFSCCLPIHGAKGCSDSSVRKRLRFVCPGREAAARPPFYSRTTRRVHSMSLLTGTELKTSEITAEARTCQIN